MEGSRFLVVVCRSSQDPVEQAERSKYNPKSVNNKLPFSQGPNKPKLYANEESWEEVLSIVEKEMLLRETKVVNTYQARAEVAENVRVALNERAGKEDHFTIQVLGAETGIGHWSNGPFMVVKVSESFILLMLMLMLMFMLMLMLMK